jgi:hypothetical protein
LDAKNGSSGVKFEIAFDFENTSGQFPLDIERLVIEGGEQEGDAIALLVTHKERRGRAPAQAADGAAAMHLPRRGSHDAEEALGVHEFSDER